MKIFRLSIYLSNMKFLCPYISYVTLVQSQKSIYYFFYFDDGKITKLWPKSKNDYLKVKEKPHIINEISLKPIRQANHDCTHETIFTILGLV